MVQDSTDPRIFSCPDCGARSIHVHVTESLALKESLGLHGQSATKVDGLPSTEFTRSVGADGETSAQDVERSTAGSRVLRSGSLPEPYRRDVRGETMRAEERRAVRAILPRYNALHGTDYDGVESDPANETWDVIGRSRSGRFAPLFCQVTFADTVSPRNLAQSEAIHAEQLSEEELLKRFWTAVEAKRYRVDAAGILVLHGWGVVTAPGTVERFARDFATELAAIAFAEIWWSDTATGGVIRRLRP